MVDLRSIKKSIASLNVSGRQRQMDNTDQQDEFQTPVFAMPRLANNAAQVLADASDSARPSIDAKPKLSLLDSASPAVRSRLLRAYKLLNAKSDCEYVNLDSASNKFSKQFGEVRKK